MHLNALPPRKDTHSLLVTLQPWFIKVFKSTKKAFSCISTNNKRHSIRRLDKFRWRNNWTNIKYTGDKVWLMSRFWRVFQKVSVIIFKSFRSYFQILVQVKIFLPLSIRRQISQLRWSIFGTSTDYKCFYFPCTYLDPSLDYL